MKLTSNSKTFPKFQNVGDRFEGTFCKFDMGLDGRFGKEDIVVLAGEHGEQHIRCPAALSRVLSDNAKHLMPGIYMTLTFTELMPNPKGMPSKIIDVDIQPAGAKRVPVPLPVAKPAAAPLPAQGDFGEVMTDEGDLF